MIKKFVDGLVQRLESALREPIMTRQAECDQHQQNRTNELQAYLVKRIDELERTLAQRGTPSPHTSRLSESLYLGNHEVLTRTQLGFHLVVPGYNVDVAIGLVRDGIIEPWTTNVVMHILQPGDTYVNVGANFGYYTLLGAQLVGRSGKVYSIEANPHVFRYLIKSVYWGGFPDVIKAFNVAAYSEDDMTMPMQFDPQFIGGGSVISAHSFQSSLQDCLWSGDNMHTALDEHGMFAHRGLFSSKDVKTVSLDHLLPEGSAPQLIHMDIEGAEADALLGAMRTIASAPQMDIIVEWLGTRLDEEDTQGKYHQVLRFLSSQGYQFYRIETSDFKGIGHPPRLKAFTLETLNQTGHCDVLATKQLRFQAELV